MKHRFGRTPPPRIASPPLGLRRRVTGSIVLPPGGRSPGRMVYRASARMTSITGSDVSLIGD
jgi:hypothetical protein